jgi:acetyl-CoA synthetase
MPNMMDYEAERAKFNWRDIERHFGWTKSGRVNIAHEVLDRTVQERDLGDQTALRYSGDSRVENYTFAELMAMSNKFANVLKKRKIKKGDRVFIFMPRSPELYTSLMGILKIGAIAGLLFEAFMERALLERLLDSGATAIITTPELKSRIPFAKLPALEHVIVVGVDDGVGAKDVDWYGEMAEASDEFKVVKVPREHPAFILYTSGSTGKPKGVVHAHNDLLGYYMTGKYVLDLQPDDIYWCTADPGWVTGLAYGVFAPWSNGVGTIVRGGRFSVESWYETLEKYRVTVWYSAPTAFRLLMAAGDELAGKYDLSHLRHILSVGEPLNPEVVRWGQEMLGLGIRDTWFMTETGMQMISNYLGLPIRLGSMGKPVPGVEAAIVDDEGNLLPPRTIGNLAIKTGWPSEMRAIWNDSARLAGYYMRETWFVSGDSAYMDEDGYFFFQGRIDDIINTAGERVGPFEVESKLLEHPAVVEAGVIGKPDAVRGEIIKAFIVLKRNFTWSDDLALELRNFVKLGLAAHAAPREFAVKDSLPKTRSGKIMRRVLKSEELGLPVGDLSAMDRD